MQFFNGQLVLVANRRLCRQFIWSVCQLVVNWHRIKVTTTNKKIVGSFKLHNLNKKLTITVISYRVKDSVPVQVGDDVFKHFVVHLWKFPHNLLQYLQSLYVVHDFCRAEHKGRATQKNKQSVSALICQRSSAQRIESNDWGWRLKQPFQQSPRTFKWRWDNQTNTETAPI